MNLTRCLLLAAAALHMAGSAVAAESAAWPAIQPARLVANAAVAPMLAVARAGQRAVAVGDHGVVLLSDDGRQFRQAKAVPVRSLLTSVQFIDERRGYAAGHDGVVLGTQDGGETWTLLRAEPGKEQPVLSLHFDSPEHGIAVGLYGWAIETRDAGRTWAPLQVAEGESADRHLMHVFTSGSGAWLIVGEGGVVFRSADKGRSWQQMDAGGKGSLWHGLALSDGSLLACGMRGHLYRSADDGKTWQEVGSQTTQSLTGIAQFPDGKVVVVGMGGTVLESRDGGRHFTATVREQQEPLTAVLTNGPQLLILSMGGPIKP